VIDTSPVAPPAAPAPTIAQRALHWIGYIGLGIFVMFVPGNHNHLDGLTFYLLCAFGYLCALLAALPATLPVLLTLPLAVGGALAGTAMLWASYQTQGEFVSYMRVMIAALIFLVARTIGLWVQSRTPPAQRDAESKSG